ncbi:MAG: O-antigen ligase family protein [Zoogloeaceae bacterium]|jgi:hypothetical protein|nr:O-antigen ligase family protein [Zoogloeaceae bacterium]
MTYDHNHLPVEKIGAWMLSIVATGLVFFQFHVVLFGETLNLNLADPFALLALAATVSHCISARAPLVWRWREFNKTLLVISVLLLFAFVYGARTIGVTSWALGGRLIGWLVLLGYLCIGPLTVSCLGMRGMRRLFETLVVMAGIVVLSCVLVRCLALAGWADNLIPGNFEGYAGNRNAFAFQMLACSVLLIAFSQYQARQARRLPRLLNRNRLLVFFHGLILTGLVLSASRAGIGAGVVLFLFVWAARLVDRRMLLSSIMWAALIWMILVWVLPWLAAWVLGNAALVKNADAVNRLARLQSGFSHESSNLVRWETIRHGLEMWLDSPFLGVGLGVFIEKSMLWFGRPTVIHSTPVWILVEFGLVGAFILFMAFFRLCVFAWRSRQAASRFDRAVFMLLGVFAVFGAVHEIFYQRIFWLALGACLALPLHASFVPYAPNSGNPRKFPDARSPVRS